MKIVITGASGQLGKTIKKEIENSYTIFPLSKDEFDITRNDLSRIEKIDPDIIINAAAFTNVEEAEKIIKNLWLVITLDQNTFQILHLIILFR